MTNSLNTLATALYVKIDDWLKEFPELAVRRPRVGIKPMLSDAELVTLAAMSALPGFTSERRWLRYAREHLAGMFPYLPGQSGYNKRLRAATALVLHMIQVLGRDTPLWEDDVWVVDSTPVECGRSRQTARRSALAGWAEYGYCASHSRFFWGLRLHLLCTLGGLPVAFALTGAKADERTTLLGMLDADPDLAARHPGRRSSPTSTTTAARSSRPSPTVTSASSAKPARANPCGPAPGCSSRCGRRSNRSTRPSRGNSTSNYTAAVPMPASSSA